MKTVAGKRFTKIHEHTPEYFEGWYKKHWFVISRRPKELNRVTGGWFDVQVRAEDGCLTCDSVEDVETIEEAILKGIQGSLI